MQIILVVTDEPCQHCGAPGSLIRLGTRTAIVCGARECMEHLGAVLPCAV